MNVEKHLILVKDQDKTEQIEYCQYINGKWVVRYHNNDTEYSYNYQNIEWYKNPKIINHETSIVYEFDQPLSGVVKILDFGEYIRIFFKRGYKKLYKSSNIIVEETSLSNRKSRDCLEYFKELAEHVSLTSDDDISFLSRQYSRLTTISPRSVLAAYLEKKPLQKVNIDTDPIFPFGFNLSQKTSTEKALSEQVSVIEGPPGTGKTQTILNIIANAVVNNKTVAVVSNNNSATANVLEKLQKYEVDFIAAYLGNYDNKEKFFDEQKNIYPNMTSWALPNKDFQLIKTNLNKSQQKLNEMLEYSNRLAALKNELSILQTEIEYFDEYYAETEDKSIKLRSFFPVRADKVISLMINYQHKLEKGNISFGYKLYNLFVHGIYNLSFYSNTPEAVIPFLQKTYYDKKLKEVKSEIEALSNKLESYNFDNAMKEYSEDSMKLFRAKLAERYGTSGNRIVFSDNALWKNFDSFIKEYPVILSTTHSLRSCTSENYLFDYVIIDEASQVDLVTGALALSCAKNAVIVGDIKQLPNVITCETAKYAKQKFESFNLERAYSYADNSLLSSIINSPEFQSLDRIMHQPLKMLIKDPTKLNNDEYKYAMNILTHTDFVIFNKLDKMPVLVVEVDGYAYHANNPKQLQRDKMKDDILMKYNIPIIRIKTNESGEERKLRRKLIELLKLEDNQVI